MGIFKKHIIKRLEGEFMHQIWMNRGYISKVATTFIGGMYAFLGFVGTLVPLDEILPTTLNIWIRIGISLAVLFLAWIVCFVIVGMVMTNKKRFDVLTVNSGHKLFLQYGDIFDNNEVVNPNERRNIVIPVNRCFDTIVDNYLISERTLHGIAFKQLYAKKIYTEESLNLKIQQLLVHKKFEELSESEKPVGNRKRYPVGTVVDLPGAGDEHYLLWALSSFDSELKAHTSMQDYALAIQKLVEACNIESEGFPILIPVVGTGLSRTKKEQSDVISYLLSAFKLNRNEINCDVHIIVREDIKNEVAIMNVK